MTYGTDAGARSFAGFPTTDEISTITMSSLLDIGTARVIDDTARGDWDSNSTQWNLINKAAEIAAAKLAVLMMSSIDKPNDRVKDLERIYQEIIKTINNAIPDVGEENPTREIFESQYQTFPLNPDADTYTSVL